MRSFAQMTSVPSDIDALVVERAIQEPEVLARAVLQCPLMGQHPLKYGDPRVRGFLFEVGTSPAHLRRLEEDAPGLADLLRRFRRPDSNLFTLSVNQYPPTDADSFLLKPHVDRRYATAGFDLDLMPDSTTVFFLAFPASGLGGELVVFPKAAFDRGPASFSRRQAGRTAALYKGLCVEPVPGRACTLEGPVPHAVIGYEAPEEGPWRSVCVLAQFTVPSDQVEAAPYRCLSQRTS